MVNWPSKKYFCKSGLYYISIFLTEKLMSVLEWTCMAVYNTWYSSEVLTPWKQRMITVHRGACTKKQQNLRGPLCDVWLRDFSYWSLSILLSAWKLTSQALHYTGWHQPSLLGILRSGQKGSSSMMTSAVSWMAASIMGVLPAAWDTQHKAAIILYDKIRFSRLGNIISKKYFL